MNNWHNTDLLFRIMGQNNNTDDDTYLFTTIDYTHSDPLYRARTGVSVHLQMNYGELVAGAYIDVGRPMHTKKEGL